MVIPNGWKHLKLGDCLSKILGGGTPSRINLNYWNGDIPWITVKDFSTFNNRNTQETITKLGLKNSASQLIPKGTPIISTRMAVGKIVIYSIDVAINQDLKALFVSDICNPQYLVYWYYYFQKNLNSFACGSTVKGIRIDDLQKLEIILPPEIEQIAIANVLTHIDDLLASLEKLIEKKRVVKQGAMQELLTGKKRLPEFNGGWYQTTISSVLSIGHGKSQKEIEDINGKYSILATSGEIGRTNEFIYDKPSVLIGRKGTIDKPQYMDKPFWTIDTLFYTIIKTDYSVKYLYYLFCIINWASYNEASGVPSLNSKIIEDIDIIIPPSLSEQSAIADILTNMDDEIEQLEQKLHKYENIKIGMMQNLLTGKIRLPTT